MANKLTTYIRETRTELKHVNWLTRAQAIRYTISVIALSVAVAVFLGFFDFIFSFLIKLII